MSVETPNRTVRIPPEMERRARAAHPELASEPISVLLRAALAALAGASITDAVRQGREAPMKRGPKPMRARVPA